MGKKQPTDDSVGKEPEEKSSLPKTENSQKDVRQPPPLGDTHSNDRGNNGESGEEEEENKDIKKGFLVCQGAVCQCSLGTSKGKLKVISHSKYFVNDADGVEKLVATKAELGNPFEITFGSCKANNNNACTPNIIGWSGHSMHIMAAGNPVLLEISKGTCSNAKGAKDTVVIVKHGQEQSLGPDHFKNMSKTTVPECNPLVPPEALEENKKLRKVRVKEITFQRQNSSSDKDDKKPETSSKDDTRKVELVYLRPEEKGIFKAIAKAVDSKNKEGDATAEEKQQISWQVYEGSTNDEGKILYTFEHHGDTLEISFEDKKIYRVKAFGGKAAEEVATLDVEVRDNELLSITGGGLQALGRTQVFKAKGIMPFTPEEAAKLRWIVRGSDGTAEDGGPGPYEASPICSHTFGSENTYSVKVWQEGDESNEKEVQVKILPNWVESIECNPKNIRPGGQISFKVSAMHFPGTMSDSERSKIKWRHRYGGAVRELTQYQGRDSFTTSEFTALGKHELEAYVKKSDFSGRDTCSFEVSLNRVLALSADKRPLLGREVLFSLKECLFADINAQDSDSIIWSVSRDGTPAGGSTGSREFRYTPILSGNYKVACTMNGQKEPAVYEFKAETLYVEKGYWALENGDKIKKAGYGQDVWFHFTQHGLSDTTFVLEVYDDDTGFDTLVYKSPGLIMPKTERVKYKIELNEDVKKAIEKNGVMNYGELYVKIKPQDGIKLKNEGQSLPEKTSDYLIVGTAKGLDHAEITNGDYTKLAKLLYINETVYVKCHARNLVGKKVKVKIWRLLRTFGLDILDYTAADKLLHEGTAEVDKSGLVKYSVPASKLNPKPEADKVWTIYAEVILLKENGKEDTLRTVTEKSGYTHLHGKEGNSGNAKTTISPVGADGLGEKLDKCPRCPQLTLEQLKEIFPGADFDKLSKTLPLFQEIFIKFDIDTCIRKAHFFSQIREEVGSKFGINKAESLNYSANRLKNGENIEGTNWIKGDTKTKTGGYYTDGKWKKAPFSYFKKNPDEADLYGRKDLDKHNDAGVQAASQEDIANRAYANKYGNGDIASGDGWKYRGRGIIQLTWKSNYERVQELIKEKYSNVDIVSTPEKVSDDDKYAIVSACAFWALNNINSRADTGTTASDVDGVTAIVNKNTDSYEQRKQHFLKTKDTFKVEECKSGKYHVVDKEIVTFYITHLGKIYQENVFDPKKARYIYIDKNSKEYDLGTHGINIVQKWNSKGALNTEGEMVKLVDLEKATLSYSKDDIKFKITIDETKRTYLDYRAVASFYGALIEISCEDLKFNGFSNSDGSPGVSKEHLNGLVGDLGYLTTDKKFSKETVLLQSSNFSWDRNVAMINALYRFGWGRTKNHLSENFALDKKTVILPRCTHLSEPRHNNHIHIRGYKPDIELF